MPANCYARYISAYSGNATVPGGSLTVEGAAVFDTLLAFQAARAVRGCMVEIGVNRGYAAALMAMHRVDPDALLLIDVRDVRPHLDETFALFGIAASDRIRVHTVDSQLAGRTHALQALYGACRWVHIDGEHSHEAVTSDLALAADLVGRNGLVAVDDVFMWETPQVTFALRDFLRDRPDRLRLVLMGFGKAYLVPPQALDMYRRFLKAHLLADLEARNLVCRLALAGFSGDSDALSVVRTTPDRPRYQVIGRLQNTPF